MRQLTIAAAAFAAISCGKQPKADHSSDARPAELQTYGVGLDHKSFSLAGVAAFDMKVEDCASGYSANLASGASELFVYKFDQGCLAKLDSITIDTETFEVSDSDPFESYLPGDVARFESVNDPSRQMVVMVVSQIDQPVPEEAPTHGVVYAYSDISAGDDHTCENECIVNSYQISFEGIPAPEMEVKGFYLKGMSDEGAGHFAFDLECLEIVTDQAPDSSCRGQRLEGMQYILVKDTYGGVLTYEQAAQLFATQPVRTVAAEDLLGAGSLEAPNGGLHTKMGDDILVGPNQMHVNPNMILLLRNSNYSIKYWNVDISPITP